MLRIGGESLPPGETEHLCAGSGVAMSAISGDAMYAARYSASLRHGHVAPVDVRRAAPGVRAASRVVFAHPAEHRKQPFPLPLSPTYLENLRLTSTPTRMDECRSSYDTPSSLTLLSPLRGLGTLFLTFSSFSSLCPPSLRRGDAHDGDTSTTTCTSPTPPSIGCDCVAGHTSCGRAGRVNCAAARSLQRLGVCDGRGRRGGAGAICEDEGHRGAWRTRAGGRCSLLRISSPILAKFRAFHPCAGFLLYPAKSILVPIAFSSVPHPPPPSSAFPSLARKIPTCASYDRSPCRPRWSLVTARRSGVDDEAMVRRGVECTPRDPDAPAIAGPALETPPAAPACTTTCCCSLQCSSREAALGADVGGAADDAVDDELHEARKREHQYGGERPGTEEKGKATSWW
ncbi:hypothetical protein MSAN_01220900 [Mycena sanguinolenta]|uniref:Uncharacterized protein n=1 Tax=Mycena sanguinolenta TaxID=230812 RepID=A0A8H6YH08_9AGAR|nr:hypothetical protein MSAN_01220900 [Mycena sanguinolenta]